MSAGNLRNLRFAFCSDPRNGSSRISAFFTHEGLQAVHECHKLGQVAGAIRPIRSRRE
jgi:hypothetical protein